jgi:tRNA-5-taurinomethyluridine 2-sulfurtransferase
MKIAVLLSGGVDSSVALRLLQRQGHEVTAFYLKIWLEDELSFLGTCPWEDDLFYARAVCDQAGIPLEVVSLQDAYWSEVVSYTIAEVRAGRTPNPDILCNNRIKFGAFYKLIDDSFDKVATGHYAQIHEDNGQYLLVSSPDEVKDQTYFLSHLSQKQLARACFPIGHLTKSQVRALAKEFDLPNQVRKDSQGICFLGKLKFGDFLKHHLGEQDGPLIEYETGKMVGRHNGYWFFTIGQRQGIGLAGGPWYVVAKQIETNVVFVSKTYNDDHKRRNWCLIGGCNWIPDAPIINRPLQVKLRHGPTKYDCVLVSRGDRVELKLASRDQGIAPGQFAVLYDGVYCLGSGTIEEGVR